MLEFIYTIVKDIWLWLRRRRRKLNAPEVVALRQKLKQEFEHKIIERRMSRLRGDVIIRDMNRVDKYPDDDKKRKGISPWFRVGLIGTYHRGIQVSLSIGKLTKDRQLKKWRYTDYKAGENGDLKVCLVGFIPFDNIEAVDWEGDEYYGFPHIYCYFNTKRKGPYERLTFCEEKYLDDTPYYTEIADYKSVNKISKKRNIDYFA